MRQRVSGAASGQARRALALAAVVLALPALAACSEDAPRDAEGEVTASGEVDAFKVQAGDCWSTTPEGEEVSSLPTIPCDQPHAWEIYAVADFPDGTFDGDDFPGDEAVVAATQQVCTDAFAEFVGVSYEESQLDTFLLYPVETSWGLGDREYVCAVGELDGETTGTLRDAKR